MAKTPKAKMVPMTTGAGGGNGRLAKAAMKVKPSMKGVK